MDRNDVIARLKAVEPEIRAHGVDALYLYGSYARDDGNGDSDIDVMVEFAADRGQGLKAFMEPYLILEEHFPGVEIGYGTSDSLVPRFRAHIEQSAIRIF